MSKKTKLEGKRTMADAGELRARLQPSLLLRLKGPVEAKKGRMRFEKDTLVIAQFWGGGQIILNPVNAQDFPAAWVYTHALEQAGFEFAELGQPKGEEEIGMG